MSGVNRVILLGRLGRDPEVKNVKGLDIVNFSIATSKTWKDDGGEKHEKTEWHDIVAFKKLAEIAGKYLSKGRQVFVEGELQTRSWDDEKSGQKKYRTEIIANRIEFIGDKGAESQNTEVPASSGTEVNEDIPF